MIKQIKFFRPENIAEFETFLEAHPDAQLLSGEHFALEKKTKFVLSIGDKKDLKAVERPSEKPYQFPIVYAIYDAEGDPPSGDAVKTKLFSVADSIGDINKFLSAHDVETISVLPVVESTSPLDNYVAGEYGPVPDRSPAKVRSHKLVVVYKE